MPNPQPQRAESPHHLDARIVPFERALLARSQVLDKDAAVIEAGGPGDPEVPIVHIPRHEDALNGTFYLTPDGPVALVRYFARNADGRKYLDLASGRPALEPQPVIVPLDALPPAHLLRTA